MTHHLQRFLYFFSAHDYKVVRVTHKMRLQFSFQVPPLPYPVENVQGAQLASSGEITPPCGVPLRLAFPPPTVFFTPLSSSPMTGALSH
jgi:hypothetical protein